MPHYETLIVLLAGYLIACQKTSISTIKLLKIFSKFLFVAKMLFAMSTVDTQGFFPGYKHLVNNLLVTSLTEIFWLQGCPSNLDIQ